MADLTCQQLVELVTDYLEEWLPEGDRSRFEAHLARCPGCETYLDQMRRTADLLGEIPVDTLSAEQQSALLSAFRDYRS